MFARGAWFAIGIALIIGFTTLTIFGVRGLYSDGKAAAITTRMHNGLSMPVSIRGEADGQIKETKLMPR